MTKCFGNTKGGGGANSDRGDWEAIVEGVGF